MGSVLGSNIQTKPTFLESLMGVGFRPVENDGVWVGFYIYRDSDITIRGYFIDEETKFIYSIFAKDISSHHNSATLIEELLSRIQQFRKSLN